MEYIHTVQYYETDKMGITHHSNYIRWMEEARVDFLSQIRCEAINVIIDKNAEREVKPIKLATSRFLMNAETLPCMECIYHIIAALKFLLTSD